MESITHYHHMVLPQEMQGLFNILEGFTKRIHMIILTDMVTSQVSFSYIPRYQTTDMEVTYIYASIMSV